jgi:hypothetical protein
MAIRGPPDPAPNSPRKPYNASLRRGQVKKEEFTTENTEKDKEDKKKRQIERPDKKPLCLSFVFFRVFRGDFVFSGHGPVLALP